MTNPPTVLAGIDNICTVADALTGKRAGLITAPTGVDRFLTPSAQVVSRWCRVEELFSPEHGLYGESQAGAGDSPYVDDVTGIDVIPLYGSRTAPDSDQLSRVDVMLYDIQDVGARYYTYLSTLTRSMKACAAAEVPFIVFDRPGMIGLGQVEGSVLDERFASFVGEYAVPTRYGLTVGEYARYINEEKQIGCALTVVPCEGLRRGMYYDDTGMIFVNPSPNINSVDCAVNYIGTCLFEATNVSEGRGTTTPFSVIGAPWLRAQRLMARMAEYRFDGVRLRRTFFTPVMSKYAGQRCEGVAIHITDRRRYQPFAFGLRLFDEIRALFPEFTVSDGLDRLFGSDRLRCEYIGRRAIDGFLSANAAAVAAYEAASRPYRIYRD
jgi:uncharacterized protein YbbC (DUF1343 family)